MFPIIHTGPGKWLHGTSYQDIDYVYENSILNDWSILYQNSLFVLPKQLAYKHWEMVELCDLTSAFKFLWYYISLQILPST